MLEPDRGASFVTGHFRRHRDDSNERAERAIDLARAARRCQRVAGKAGQGAEFGKRDAKGLGDPPGRQEGQSCIAELDRCHL